MTDAQVAKFEGKTVRFPFNVGEVVAGVQGTLVKEGYMWEIETGIDGCYAAFFASSVQSIEIIGDVAEIIVQ